LGHPRHSDGSGSVLHAEKASEIICKINPPRNNLAKLQQLHAEKAGESHLQDQPTTKRLSKIAAAARLCRLENAPNIREEKVRKIRDI
jgi:hypothetical protein